MLYQNMLETASSRDERQPLFTGGSDEFLGGEWLVVGRAGSDEDGVARRGEEGAVDVGCAHDTDFDVRIRVVNGVA